MVHRLIFFLTFFCVSVQAQKNYNAVIFQHDGTQINCTARLPTMFENTIKFKIDNNGKFKKMKSKDIKTICYFLRGDKTIELEYLQYYSLFKKNNIEQDLSDTEWLEVVVNGHMTLYVSKEVSRGGQSKSSAYHYFVKRENEEIATEIAYVRYSNGFLIHRMEIEDYFADAPGIEEKIKNKEEGYTAKEIINIVTEYNAFRKTVTIP